MTGWFRWWHGTVSDPKFGAISMGADCSLPDVIAVWCVLLEQASQDVTRGNVTGVTSNEVAWMLRIDETKVRYIIDAMTSRGLIKEGRICAWDRRQPAREDAIKTTSKPVAQRVAEHRERKRQEQENKDSLQATDVTPCNAYVTPQIREDKSKQPPLPPVTDSQEKTESASPTGSAGCAVKGFAEFWSAYPKKVGKGDAERKWKSQKPPLAIVLAAVKQQSGSEQWLKEGGQFIPNPSTWLHQRRWEDDPASLAPTNGKAATYTKPDWAHGAI